LYCDLDISFAVMALGGQIKAPTLAGHEKSSIFRPELRAELVSAAGKGMPDVYNRRHPGDLVVIARVGRTQKPERNQKGLLRDFASNSPDTGPSDSETATRGLLGRWMDSFR